MWSFFDELDRKRHTSINGYEPIDWQDIKAWSDLWGVTLTHEELELIDALDETFRAVWGEYQKAERDKTKGGAQKPAGGRKRTGG